MVRKRPAPKKRVAPVRKTAMIAPPQIRILATREKGPKRPCIGSGATVRHLDRETISISHAYIYGQVSNKSYYGNLRVDVFDSPVINSMAGIYTRFRYRYLKVDWQPAVSSQTAGVIAFTCSTIQGMEATPDLVSLGSLPGAHVGLLNEKGGSVCDTRVFLDEWYNIAKGHGAYTGVPRVIWTSVGVQELTTVAGYFTASVTIEFSSPSYIPYVSNITRETSLTARLEALQLELSEVRDALEGLQEDEDELGDGSASLTNLTSA